MTILPTSSQPLFGADIPTQVQINRRRRLAEALRSNAIDTSPVGSWTQALARVVEGSVAGMNERSADKADTQRSQALAAAIQGGADPSQFLAAGEPDIANYLSKQNRYGVEDKQWQDKFNADQAWRNRPPDPTTDIQNYQYGQTHPGFAAAQGAQNSGVYGNIIYGNEGDDPNNIVTMALPKQGGPLQRIPPPEGVHVLSPYEKASATAGGTGSGKYWSETEGKIYDEGRKALTGLNTLTVMDQMTNDPNFYSGFGANQLAGLKQVAVALGGDPNQVSSMETFNTLGRQALLDKAGGSLGNQISNGDVRVIFGTMANLENTPQGNKKIIAIGHKLYQRQVEVSQLAAKYKQEHGHLDEGFDQVLRQFAEANPLFPPAANSGGQPGESMPQGTGRPQYNFDPQTGDFQ